MALGKNLKKRELIPSGEKPERKKTKTPSKKAVAAKESVAKTEQAVKLEARVVTVEKQGKNVSDSHRKVISKQEFERRQRLKSKYKAELEQLADKKVQVIVFKLGQEEYALDINRTREVVVTPRVTRMPHVPPYIKGVANIRGMVFLIMDLAKKFNLSDGEELAVYTMVIESEQKIGILVQEVPATLIVKGNSINPSSGMIADAALDETYIKGVIQLDDRMIFYLDIDELIEGDKVCAVSEELIGSLAE